MYGFSMINVAGTKNRSWNFQVIWLTSSFFFGVGGSGRSPLESADPEGSGVGVSVLTR